MIELHNAQVQELTDLSAGAYFLRLRPQSHLTFYPGQHTQIEFHDKDGSFLRYYSLANAPRATGELEFFIQAVDARLKTVMEQMRIGASLKLSSPQGLFRLANHKRPIVLIGGGTGIAPLRAMFEQLTHGFTLKDIDHKLHVLYGVRHADTMFAHKEFLRFHHAKLNNIKICITAEQGQHSDLRTGRVTQHINDMLLQDADYYLCGPPAMLNAVRTQLVDYGITTDQIFQEGF